MKINSLENEIDSLKQEMNLVDTELNNSDMSEKILDSLRRKKEAISNQLKVKSVECNGVKCRLREFFINNDAKRTELISNIDLLNLEIEKIYEKKKNIVSKEVNDKKIELVESNKNVSKLKNQIKYINFQIELLDITPNEIMKSINKREIEYDRLSELLKLKRAEYNKIENEIKKNSSDNLFIKFQDLDLEIYKITDRLFYVEEELKDLNNISKKNHQIQVKRAECLVSSNKAIRNVDEQLQSAVNRLNETSYFPGESKTDENTNLINDLMEQIKVLKLKDALNKMIENQEDVDFNKLINGFGIIVKKNGKLYEIIYNEGYLQGKTFTKVKFDEKKNELTLIDKRDENLSDIVLKFDEKNKINLKKHIEIRDKITKLKEKRKTLEILKDLVEYSKEKYETHNEAQKNYNCKNLGFVFPSIFITGISGVASFIASSSLIDPVSQNYLSLGVGILASIATVIQSVASAMNYSGKAEAHGIATDEYDNIHTIVSFEMENPTESIENPNKFYTDIKNNILEVKKKCNYIIPNHITEKYNKNILNNRFRNVKNKILQDAIKKKAEGIRSELVDIKNSDDINLDVIKSKIEFVID